MADKTRKNHKSPKKSEEPCLKSLENVCLPSLLSYASRSSASWVNKKGAKSYAGHIASRYLAVNIVFELKSLILLLFLGAVTVVLIVAENPFDDKAVQEYLDE